MRTMGQPVWEAIERFWLRDFETDVPKLNRILAKTGQQSAGLQVAPPSVLTGDPNGLEPGNCLMVLGINPGWRNTPEFRANDIEPALAAHRAGDFERYRKRRSEYFRGGPEFHGGHYTRLGAALRSAFSNQILIQRDRKRSAKELFDKHILMADLLPWWSSTAGSLDLARIGNVPFYLEWQNIVRQWISTFQPQAIIVNTCGSATRAAIRLLLGVELRSFSMRPRAYCGSYLQTPVFVHPPLNHSRELSHERYCALAAEWQDTTATKVALRVN